ncbi:MAG: class I SAM-dependent methyltransferase [Candidatus Acidiferrales bacterium]
MGVHYDEDYHAAIITAGETSAATRWGWARERILSYKSKGAILDIGCSSGAFLGIMNDGSWKLHGIEMAASSAEMARATTGAEIFVGDALDAPFRPNSFDVITCFDVLEHVYQPQEFLKKILEWLKPGGIFYACLPNIDSWEARMLGTYWYGLELPRHLSHFSPRSLSHVMTALGFQEIFVRTTGISYLERSAGYVYCQLLQKLGFSPTPPSKVRPRNLARRGVRKIMRLTLIEPFGRVACWTGRGASLEAMFEKKTPFDRTGDAAGSVV